MPRLLGIQTYEAFYNRGGGGGGNRTRGTGFSQCNCLAGSPVRPLQHPSAAKNAPNMRGAGQYKGHYSANRKSRTCLLFLFDRGLGLLNQLRSQLQLLVLHESVGVGFLQNFLHRVSLRFMRAVEAQVATSEQLRHRVFPSLSDPAQYAQRSRIPPVV